MTQQYKKYCEKPFKGSLEIHPTAKLHNPWLDYSGGLIIEKYVDISRGVQIFTHTHTFHRTHWQAVLPTPSPLCICKGVFIGVNAIILCGVKRIGKWSVIGAGSVLTKSVPDYEIWAGNPAKKIGGVKKR